MSCPRGRARPNEHTKRRLFAASAGYCQNPGCHGELFRDTGSVNIHIAEIAHVFSASDHGPRAEQKLTSEERADYSNLILLCTNCHTTIDKAEVDFPDDLILGWKQSHLEKIRQLFGIEEYTSREEARKVIAPILAQNKVIFDTYGPMGEQRLDPESELAQKWIERARAHILPNNRKLLEILDANEELMTERENNVLEIFRQHVCDFESKHVGKSETSGVRFPHEMNHLFGDENE